MQCSAFNMVHFMEMGSAEMLDLCPNRMKITIHLSGEVGGEIVIDLDLFCIAV